MTDFNKALAESAALRDALLPKLISGEIRVKDAERLFKEREL
jgi:type I restriction enzyme S subunit